jgi:hypothetical protein
MRTKSAEMKYIKEHQSAFDAALARATLSIRQNAALVGLNKIREPLAFCAALKAINYPNAPAGFTPPKEAGEPTMELQQILDVAYEAAITAAMPAAA